MRGMPLPDPVRKGPMSPPGLYTSEPPTTLVTLNGMVTVTLAGILDTLTRMRVPASAWPGIALRWLVHGQATP